MGVYHCPICDKVTEVVDGRRYCSDCDQKDLVLRSSVLALMRPSNYAASGGIEREIEKAVNKKLFQLRREIKKIAREDLP